MEPLYGALKEHLKQQEALRKSEVFAPLPGLENLVFTDPTGKPRRPQDDRRAWKRLLDEAKVPTELRVHDNRHFAASIMLALPGITTEQGTVR